jgi:hypothetical protein
LKKSIKEHETSVAARLTYCVRVCHSNYESCVYKNNILLSFINFLFPPSFAARSLYLFVSSDGAFCVAKKGEFNYSTDGNGDKDVWSGLPFFPSVCAFN